MRGDWLLTEQAVAPTEKASVDQCAVPAVHARSAQSVKRGNAERIAAVKPTRICGIYKKKEGTNRNGSRCHPFYECHVFVPPHVCSFCAVIVFFTFNV